MANAQLHKPFRSSVGFKTTIITDNTTLGGSHMIVINATASKTITLPKLNSNSIGLTYIIFADVATTIAVSSGDTMNSVATSRVTGAGEQIWLIATSSTNWKFVRVDLV